MAGARREIRVYVIEDDPFARNWIVLLCARDWRTRVVGESGTAGPLLSALRQPHSRPLPVDVLVIDVDGLPPGVLSGLFQQLEHSRPAVRVLLTMISPHPELQAWSRFGCVAGAVLKEEINYSLNWALDLVQRSRWVLTPGIESALIHRRAALPACATLLDGRRLIANFTAHEADVARLALIFSMERPDIADEKTITIDTSYGLVSLIYQKLGLPEILTGEIRPEQYLGDHPLMLAHFQEILAKTRQSKKKSDQEALAFHLLTTPEIQDLS